MYSKYIHGLFGTLPTVGAASKYHLACVELEQVPKNWTHTSCMSSGLAKANNGGDDVNCHVNFLI